MSKSKRLLKYGTALAVVAVLCAALAFVYAVGSGLVDRWARRTIVEQLERMTGARAELGNFHFSWWFLRAKLDNLTLHGSEPAGAPPLFHADHLEVDLRVDSLWNRKISLGRVEMSNFSAQVRVARDGSTNFPGPKVPLTTGKPALQRLFDLKIAQLRLENGELLWNDMRVPLIAEGGNFEFAMDYAAEAGRSVYIGGASWQKFTITARRYIPFGSDLLARFILRPDSVSFTQLHWKIPHSEIDAQADLSSFVQPAWTFRYRAQLDFADIRSILRKPHAPSGQVEFTGDGRYAEKQMSFAGRYTARNFVMKYQWFHPAGAISSRGSYRADQRMVDVPDFEANVLGGNVSAHVHLDVPTLHFRAESKAQGLDLRQIFVAEDNPNLPIIPLHWAGSVDIDSVTTWVADFKHLDSNGLMIWAPSTAMPSGQIPVSAHVPYHFETDRKGVELAPGEIDTPSARIAFHGTLGLDDSSSLDSTVDTENLSLFDDFINRIRGENAEPQVIGGHFHWQGRLTGSLIDPTFAGHVKGTEARYGALYWDDVEGELTYSSRELHLARGRVRIGRSSADLELSLAFDEWSFAPGSEWSFDTNLVAADTDNLQQLLGTSFPVHATLNGQFHGKGTHANPELSALFDMSDVTAWTWRLSRARGQLTLRNGEVRITNAEVRLPTYAPGAPAGLLTGNVLYYTNTHEVSFDLTGAAIPLEVFPRLQPFGGNLNMQLHGQGSLLAPQLHATLRLINLKYGADVIGSFEGTADSDGKHLTAQIESALAAGKVTGKVDMTLGGQYPFTGEVTGEQIPFDTFIVSAMHLTGLTGHSQVDGHFAISGLAAQPETIAVEANLSRLVFDYENIRLENAGPVRLNYRKDQVRIEQANLRGANTDFSVTGSASFAGSRALDLRVNGAVSLPLLAGFVPRLEASGRAQVNAAVAGTISAPRFNGKIHVEGASFRYGDFPAGLNNLAGDINFDANRMLFDNVTAESGGGILKIGGTVNYAEGPLTYAVTLHSDRLRIRYPVGMSWLLEGSLSLVGDTHASVLSGRVVIDRLLMVEGFDIASLLASTKEPVGAPTSSSFLRNLQFDVEADSSPDAHLEWTGASVQTDANLRVRGTWDHPILLGHIQLLDGEMDFRGNRYTISRGDIDFANPFRLDPVLNVEATTTIRQYQVTLDFTGPASRLTLAYRSDPPMPSSDIISLLALGQTGEESAQRTATGQNTGVGASALLSEAISGQVGSRIQHMFGVSHFSVGPSVAVLTSPQQTSIASVTVEQQVTPNLDITYITDVTTTQYQIIQFDYAITRQLSISALRDENGTFGLEIVRKTRFK